MTRNRLRVALVCPYDLTVPGGVQSHVRELAQELQRGGDETIVLAPTGSETSAGVRGVGGSLPVRFNRSVAPVALSPLAVRRTLAEIAAFDPDVVHVHEPAVPAVSLGTTMLARRPLVGTFHAWSASARSYRLAGPLLRPAIRRLSGRIAVSPPAAEYHSRALGLRPDDFTVIPNGIDVSRFSEAEPDPALRSEMPTLLFVGRLEPRKGLDDLLTAYLHLREKGIEARLIIAGEGSGRAGAQRRIPSDVQPDVIFLGRVEPPDLPRCHASADVFVAPSLGGESFGIVLVEAMAAGLPVVASAIPGYRSVVTDGEDGLLVPPGDPDALATTIERLLGDHDARRRIGRAGSESAARYDWSALAGRIREVYTKAVPGT